MSFMVFLIDEDGGNRGALEGDTIADCLDQLNGLDGYDALERGCMYLSASEIIEESGKEYPVTFGTDCKYHLTTPIYHVE